MTDLIDFDLPKGNDNIIKVIGVGGGGGNAVNHMFKMGIKDVDFAVCNTDAQALANSAVPLKVQLGAELTEGRGAGNKPDIGRDSAVENIEEIGTLLSENTKMVFITAGMGGGTGTGAAPVIAREARDRKILTIGIVTIPFRNEGRLRIQQAIAGIREMESQVDSLLVINNERIREIYGDFPISLAFAKADDVLAIAAKGIAEIITNQGFINVDFEDVRTVMQNSGVAIMGSAVASGENRAIKAIEGAINSPLLNNNDIFGARNLLVNITSGEEPEVTMTEVEKVNEYVQKLAGNNADLIFGIGVDPELGSNLNVTVIATGFKSSSIPELNPGKKLERERVQLVEDMEVVSLGELAGSAPAAKSMPFQPEPANSNDSLIYDLYKTNKPAQIDVNINAGPDVMRVNFANESEDRIEELMKVPAYQRRKVAVTQSRGGDGRQLSRYSLSNNPDEGIRLKKNNSFLHGKAD